MVRNLRGKVIPLRDAENGPASVAGDVAPQPQPPRVELPRRFPVVTTPPRLPLMIPDEILDYYGWVFCQGGFLNLQMTFEQFLAVVAAISPTGLCPEYDEVAGSAVGAE